MEHLFLRWVEEQRFLHLREDYVTYCLHELRAKHGRYHLGDCITQSVKPIKLIIVDFNTPVGQIIRKFGNQEFEKKLAFLGKDREQYFQECFQNRHESTNARIVCLEHKIESFERKNRELEEYQFQAQWREYKFLQQTWHYRLKRVRWNIELGFRQFYTRIIFPLRIRFDRRYRDYWMSLALVHNQFKEEHQAQLRCWDEESKARSKALHEHVQLTIERNHAIFH